METTRQLSSMCIYIFICACVAKHENRIKKISQSSQFFKSLLSLTSLLISMQNHNENLLMIKQSCEIGDTSPLPSITLKVGEKTVAFLTFIATKTAVVQSDFVSAADLKDRIPLRVVSLSSGLFNILVPTEISECYIGFILTTYFNHALKSNDIFLKFDIRESDAPHVQVTDYLGDVKHFTLNEANEFKHETSFFIRSNKDNHPLKLIQSATHELPDAAYFIDTVLESRYPYHEKMSWFITSNSDFHKVTPHAEKSEKNHHESCSIVIADTSQTVDPDDVHFTGCNYNFENRAIIKVQYKFQ